MERISYKLVALDLDGTLLNSQSQLSAKHIEAVKKAQNAGIQETVMKFTIDDEKRINGWQDIILPSIIKIRANAEFFNEYVHHQTSKTNGLIKVLDLYGINPSEVIPIGDFYNDLDMIEYAG